MTNEQFERAQVAKFAAVTTEKLILMGESLVAHRGYYTLCDEIANELDRRAAVTR